MRLGGRVGITKRSMAKEFHVLMTLLGLKVNEENVQTFKHYWKIRKRSEARLSMDTVTLHKSDHQLYLMALCGVIKKYSALEAYFPAPHEIEIILPFVLQLVNTTVTHDTASAIQYFKTGVYQSLFGYDKSKCNSNSYELTDDWHIPGKTESGKPAFYLVCIYLFMVAMNVRAESAASIEKAIKVKITERLPIPLSFSKLFEKDVFKESRQSFVDVFEKGKQVVEYRGQCRALAAHLEKKFSEVAAFCVTLYTDDTYTDLMKAPDFTPHPIDSLKNGSGTAMFICGRWDSTMKNKLYSFIYTYSQILQSDCDICKEEPFYNSIGYLLCGIVSPDEPSARNDTWIMKFHGRSNITYEVEIRAVYTEMAHRIKSANSVFEVKQLFSIENVCNILRKKASTVDGKYKLTFSGADADKNEKKLRWYCETLMSQHITLNTTNAANPWLYPSLLLTDVYNQLARTDAATEAPFFDSSFFKPSIFGTSAE